jgi:hypothetical protein
MVRGKLPRHVELAHQKVSRFFVHGREASL